MVDEKRYKIINGDSLKVLDTIEPNSIDAIVTDPPYELGFMGKSWDASGIAYNVDLWKKALRVLKPGGYLLAFGGSRTFHRIACAIEDAGFEIRDTIMWLYGSGFPKSMNIGLAVDKKNGVESKVIDTKTIKKLPTTGIIAHEKEGWRKGGYDIDYQVKQATNKWNGWGTCLKPAFEPIIVARKPFNGSLIENIEKNGVGGLNIDGCRIEYKGEKPNIGGRAKHDRGEGYGFKALGDKCSANNSGRFPANVILTYDKTDKDEVCGGMPDTSSEGGCSMKNSMFGLTQQVEDYNYHDSGSAARYFYCAKASKKDRDGGLYQFENVSTGKLQGGRKENSAGSIMKNADGSTRVNPYAGTGAPKKNIHPTVKPVELMQYLVRLVTPKGGVVLDIFNGSGSTGKAVAFENRERDADYKYIGIELDPEYCEISKGRIDYAVNKFEYDLMEEIEEQKKTGQLSLFDFGFGENDEEISNNDNTTID